MYYIREHYADVYFKTNYNVKKDDVQYFDYVGGTYNVSDGDEVAANEFLDWRTRFLVVQSHESKSHILIDKRRNS